MCPSGRGQEADRGRRGIEEEGWKSKKTKSHPGTQRRDDDDQTF